MTSLWNAAELTCLGEGLPLKFTAARTINLVFPAVFSYQTHMF